LKTFKTEIGDKRFMDQKKLLEKWLKQIKNGEISPSALGLGNDREKAIQKLQNLIKKISFSQSVNKKS